MKIIFLTYTNRSGSTFLANQFSKSDEVCVCPEAHILVELFLVQPNKQVNSNILALLNKHFFKNNNYKNWELDENYIINDTYNLSNFDCFIRILEAYKNKVKPKANTLLFKAERLIELYTNFNHPRIKQYKIFWIALIRDCRAVFNSQKNTLLPGSNKYMSVNPVRTALFWNTFVNQSKELSENKNYIQIKYEVLINSTNEIICEATRFLNVGNFLKNTHAGDLYSRLPENHKSIHKNIDSSPLVNRIDAWKAELKRKDIYLVELIAKENLIAMEYNVPENKPSISLLLKAYIFVFFDNFRKVLKKITYKLRTLLHGF